MNDIIKKEIEKLIIKKYPMYKNMKININIKESE